jgi:anti-sigma regulatory factor (Ser/Thr protein kinase)
MKPPPSFGNSERRAFVARFQVLTQAAEFVEAFGARNGLAESDVLRLQLVVEELFTNTINHGYGRECDEPIELTLSALDGGVRVLYQDAAHAYDPLATLDRSRADLDAPLEERPVGQLGVRIVAGLVDDARYARSGDRNELQLSMHVTR